MREIHVYRVIARALVAYVVRFISPWGEGSNISPGAYKRTVINFKKNPKIGHFSFISPGAYIRVNTVTIVGDNVLTTLATN